jgi:hypothetical protein
VAFFIDVCTRQAKGLSLPPLIGEYHPVCSFFTQLKCSARRGEAVHRRLQPFTILSHPHRRPRYSPRAVGERAQGSLQTQVRRHPSLRNRARGAQGVLVFVRRLCEVCASTSQSYHLGLAFGAYLFSLGLSLFAHLDFFP